MSRPYGMPSMQAVLAASAMLVCLAAGAQTKSAADGIAEYRKMLEDGNPAELFEAKGEALWKQRRGPKNASLEACDLGKGPGVVKGAFVETAALLRRHRTGAGPRIAAADLHGDAARASAPTEIAKTPFGRGEQVNVDRAGDLDRRRSRGMNFNLPQGHAEERRFFELGKRAFFFRGGPTTSPARRATAKTASASACRTCRL